ncbi:MAG: 2-oxoacid:acceptor oxidoreductase family protein [Candidatus Omnitrophica bacterium]|nr:2-oxoacid:acceptor oxidoreductase family protein [Candidatus Omnitrophota bacterium]MDD5236443.1 2-oxoacid:acceptor oxidoreductase family protein [Candidatus Omnitrophota bacterium]MDD5610749.1 2-oxoacid:acceptor oxidoreductase family protein [Candidatus Omnitrophota bacterium]
MTERVIISGFGGQGIMLLGKLLAQAALNEGKNVTWFPAYGAEVRGGASYCMVIISDDEIASPILEKADTLIAMNGISLEKFKPNLTPKGLLIANTSLVDKDIELKTGEVVKAPFTDIASKLGNIKVANTVALGAYLARRKTISEKNVLKAIEDLAPQGRQDLIAINKKALAEGIKYASG